MAGSSDMPSGSEPDSMLKRPPLHRSTVGDTVTVSAGAPSTAIGYASLGDIQKTRGVISTSPAKGAQLPQHACIEIATTCPGAAVAVPLITPVPLSIVNPAGKLSPVATLNIAPAGIPDDARAALSNALAAAVSDESSKVGGFIKKAFGGAVIIKGPELDALVQAGFDDAGTLMKAVE